MATASRKRKSQQRSAFLRLLLMLCALILINVIASRLHYSLDLTQEKRFTLSPATKTLLHNMDDVAVVEVYLKGKLPAGFQRLSESVRDRLNSFKQVAGNHIVFTFTDPLEGKTTDEQAKVAETLYPKGITLMNVDYSNEDENRAQKLIIPYALVRYKGREKAVRLLENHMGMDPEQLLNYSESLLEYKFATAINTLNHPAPTKIGWVYGHGESLGPQSFDALVTLQHSYHVDSVDLNAEFRIDPTLKAIIINKPTVPFDEKEKFKIDQYIMHGGNVLWGIDGAKADMDSFYRPGQPPAELFIALSNDLNLDDMLFHYGVRVNTDLIEDLQSNPIEITEGQIGNQPQKKLKNWQYFPVLVPESHHPIVNNMEGITSLFCSSIDTASTPDVQKTVLLTSSKYSRAAMTPMRVSLSILNAPANEALYNKPFRPVAVLLEGRFTSIYTNRIPGSFLQILSDSLNYAFQPATSKPGKQIVLGDGDILTNDYTMKGPYEMGYWRFTETRFANKNFMLNCMEYLTDTSGLLEARSKDTRLRLLDHNRVKTSGNIWKVLNIAIPAALIIVFAAVFFFFRKRRYEARAI